MTAPAGPPIIPADLLLYLERVYPDRSPSIGDSKRTIWMKAGQADLIRNLRRAFATQNGAARVTQV